MTGLMIGGMESAFYNAADNRAHYGGGNNKIVTLSTSTPSTGRAFHVVERSKPSLERTKDMVFWLYDFSFTSQKVIDSDGDEHMTMYYSYPPDASPAQEIRMSYSFQTDGSNYPISDELFQPGQQGRRIISNSFKDAPWLRYPHLM
jgi:hypothetical protein